MALLDRFRVARPTWESPDPAVRAEAVRGLKPDDRELLVAIFRGDTDASVRRAALRRIGDVAVLVEAAAADPLPEIREEAAALVLRLAMEGGEPADALAAAESVNEPRQLAALARGARVPAVRDLAIERLTDERALAAVAKTAEEPRQRLAALSRVADPALRADVAVKSEHKDVALAALEGVADPDTLRAVAEHARAKAAARRARALLDALEAAARPAPPPPPIEPDPDETPEARAAREAREASLESRRLLVERALGFAGEDTAPLDEAQAAWGRLPPLAGAEADALQARFEAALAAARDRLEAEARRRQEQARAEREAEQQARLAEQAAEAARVARENAARLAAVCARAEALLRSEAPALRDVERAMREIRTGLQDPGPLPGKREHETLVEKLKHARAALYPRLQELREADEWQRWANTQVQEELVAQMEALAQTADLGRAEAELHQLNTRWRQFSQARKDEAEALWLRFKTAREALQARLDEYLKQRAELEAAHLDARRALVEKAEALAGSTDWVKTAAALQALQAEWKTVGPAPHREQQKLWERFHAACDRFFTARKQDMGRRKDEWALNLEKKEALILQAEALQASTDWEPAAVEIRRLQAEWKAVGPVKKSRSDALWRRFKAACDGFFERYKRRDDIAAEQNAAAREALIAELETLAPGSPDAAAPADLAPRVQDLLARWRDAPPPGGTAGSSQQDRLLAARDRLIEAWPQAFAGTDLDPEANRAKREKLVQRVEAAAQAHAPGGASDGAASLAERLREALATNAMGGRAVAEARWREAAHEIEQAQAAWKRLGPMPGEAGRALQARFQKACDAVHSRRPR